LFCWSSTDLKYSATSVKEADQASFFFFHFFGFFLFLIKKNWNK
jgi:hypothetical protein